jgi:hypothetical protein
MKQRIGFVSNSSSCSFYVCIETSEHLIEENLVKARAFFTEDAKYLNASDSEVAAYIAGYMKQISPLLEASLVPRKVVYTDMSYDGVDYFQRFLKENDMPYFMEN